MTDITWFTRPSDAGQMIRVEYGSGEDGIVRRTTAPGEQPTYELLAWDDLPSGCRCDWWNDCRVPAGFAREDPEFDEEIFIDRATQIWHIDETEDVDFPLSA